MKNLRFSTEIHSSFASTLKQRVNQHLTANKIDTNANSDMVMKTISAFAIYLVPFFMMLVLRIENTTVLIGLAVIMGIGKAFMGMAVMHDSLHGSYSKKKSINQLVAMSTWVIGIYPTNWKIQHNVLHHSFTNIEHVDEDIDPRFAFRFSPNQPRFSLHRYQHLYAFFFYGLSTLLWVTVKDFIKLFKYRKNGLLKPNRPFYYDLIEIIARKVFYFTVFLVVPTIVMTVSFWIVVMVFVIMHFTAGVILTFIFQCAHVMETSEFIETEEELIPENRLVHQLRTTTNFGVKNNLLFWFCGGLNHQIEHHLFPNICHVHYRKISDIVRSTALEFDLPYHIQPSLGTAIVNHLRMLRNLGAKKYDLAKANY